MSFDFRLLDCQMKPTKVSKSLEVRDGEASWWIRSLKVWSRCRMWGFSGCCCHNSTPKQIFIQTLGPTLAAHSISILLSYSHSRGQYEYDIVVLQFLGQETRLGIKADFAPCDTIMSIHSHVCTYVNTCAPWIADQDASLMFSEVKPCSFSPRKNCVLLLLAVNIK